MKLDSALQSISLVWSGVRDGEIGEVVAERATRAILEQYRHSILEECPPTTCPECHTDISRCYPLNQTVLKVECAWCGADRGEKDGKGQTGTTGGICPGCLAKELAAL